MLKVLIVDDEAVVRRGIVLGVDWASMGCVVVGEASNGDEGIAAAEQYSPNLIITDVRMPKMDGIAMMQELRRRGSRAHVIMLTAYSDFDYARSALQFGADDYLLKPFQDKELVAAIERIHRKEQEKSGLSVSDELPLAKGDKSRYVLEAMEYISEHYAESSINITEIAQHLGVSEGHLSHVFKKETGYTVLNYLTQYRICMAFLNTIGKMLQIAHAAGSDDGNIDRIGYGTGQFDIESAFGSVPVHTGEQDFSSAQIFHLLGP